MKYFADKNGIYIGSNDIGITPDDAVFKTEKMPESVHQKYDAVNDLWVDDFDE